MDKFIGLDYETYYDKEYSLRKMSTWNYVFDKERFDAYLVAIYGETIRYVGPPSEFDWDLLSGYTQVMHNAHFDGLVNLRLQQDGIIPKDLNIAGYVDTADMAAFLRVPRNLKGAVKQLLGIDMSKATRDNMKGKSWKEAVELGLKDEVVAYGGLDAEYTYKIWDKFNHLWPKDEQELSKINRDTCWKGIPVDVPTLDKAANDIKIKVWEVEKTIPWHGTEKTLSPKAIRAECAKYGMSCPGSFAATSEDAQAWEAKYENEYPWVKAIKEFRSINAHAKKVYSLQAGVREDGTFPFQIKYHGAGPGRFSGGGDSGGKYNMLNQPREEMFGVFLRELLIAGEGYSFLIFDYEQVEARVLLWRAGDFAMLERIAGGESPYEAHARLTMGWTGGPLKKENPDLYALAKARILGAGYQCGYERFVDLAWAMAKVRISLEDSKETIASYRANNQPIVEYWARHQRGLITSVMNHDATHEIELVSGRSLTYYHPRAVICKRKGKDGKMRDSSEYVASVVRGEPPQKFYGGKLTENEIQATARDLLKDGTIALVNAGYEVPFTVYDEYVVRVKDCDIERGLVEIPAILKKSSPWATGCPIDLEAKVSKCYTK